MAPLVGFTKLKNKLLNGEKYQTIRKPRKYPIHVGDKLYLYWKLRTKECEKLGEGRVISIQRKRFCDLTELDAQYDGFSSLHELIVALEEMHKPRFDSMFDIITWVWIEKCWEGGIQ